MKSIRCLLALFPVRLVIFLAQRGWVDAGNYVENLRRLAVDDSK